MSGLITGADLDGGVPTYYWLYLGTDLGNGVIDWEADDGGDLNPDDPNELTVQNLEDKTRAIGEIMQAGTMKQIHLRIQLTDGEHGDVIAESVWTDPDHLDHLPDAG